MKAIADNGLNTELQELYLVNKQWLSDLDFLKTELSFLEKRFGTSFAPLMKKSEADKMNALLAKNLEVDETSMQLKIEINNFLHKIEQQMLNITPILNFDFIEQHGKHISKITSVMQTYHLIKSKIFSLAENSLKADPYLHMIRKELK